MKWYGWLVITAVTIGAHASGNPFELNQNFQKIEKEQESLLKGIKAVAAAQEARDDAELDEETDVDEAPAAEVKQPEKKPVVTPKATEEEKPVTAETHKEEQERIALKKLEEERAVYKRAQEAELKRLEAEKARLLEEEKHTQNATPHSSEEASGVDIDIAKEQAEAKRKADEELKKAIVEAGGIEPKQHTVKEADSQKAEKKAPKMPVVAQHTMPASNVSVSSEDTSGVDINISKEELESKKKADEELKKAIAEVDEEN